MVLEMQIKSVQVSDSGNYKCFVDKTWYLATDSYVTLGAIEYRVIAFEQDSYITLQGASEPLIGFYNIAPLTFEHGKYLQMLSDIKGTQPVNLFPLCWLLETFDSELNLDKANRIEQTSNMRLFFLNTCSWADLTAEDHYRLVITPMLSVLDQFKNDLRISRTTEYTQSSINIRPHARFTTYKNELKGEPTESSILPIEVSGLEVNITLAIKRGCKIY